MMFFTRLASFTATVALSAGTAFAQSAPPANTPPASATAAPTAPAPTAATPQPAAAPTQVEPVAAQPANAAPPAAPPTTAQPAPVVATYPAYQAYPPPPAYQPPPPSRPVRQKNDLLVVTYNTAVGLGDTHTFTPDFSFLGFSFDWRARVDDKFWPGISLGWQVLYGKGMKTLHYGNTTFTGTIATNLNLFPMLVTGNYYFMTDPRGVRPYGGFGIGAYAAEHRLDVGIWTVSETSWHFGFAPELGVVLPTGSKQLVFATKFNYASASGRWDPLMYLNFNLGVEL